MGADCADLSSEIIAQHNTLFLIHGFSVQLCHVYNVHVLNNFIITTLTVTRKYEQLALLPRTQSVCE